MARNSPAPVAHLTWEQVLAFRLNRQFLEPRTTKNAVEVTRRLCGVQAQVASAAALAIAVRQRTPKRSEVDKAVRARTLVKTWAMRGTLHLLPADEVATYVASLSRLQPWRAKAWERYHGVAAADVERVIHALGEVLGAEPMGREQLAVEVGKRIRSKTAREKLGSGWAELLKPAAWAGVLLQGPPVDGHVTFVRADAWIDGWRMPDPDEAGVDLVRNYLRAHGPAAVEHFSGWWSRQQPGKVRPWFERLGDEIAPVDVEGAQMWMLAKDVPVLERTRPTDVVRLLGNFDQWVLGPAGGSAVIPAEHKADVSRSAGWISRVVLKGGRVVGVWEVDERSRAIRVDSWEPLSARALAEEIDRMQGL